MTSLETDEGQTALALEVQAVFEKFGATCGIYLAADVKDGRVLAFGAVNIGPGRALILADQAVEIAETMNADNTMAAPVLATPDNTITKIDIKK